MLPPKIGQNNSGILMNFISYLTILQKGVKECHPRKFVESFMHFRELYLLFSTICFLTLGILIVMRDNLLESFMHFIAYLTIFLKGVRADTPENLQNSLCILLYFIAYLPSFGSELQGQGCYPRKIFMVLPIFRSILLIILHYFPEKGLLVSTCNFQNHSCIFFVLLVIYHCLFRKRFWGVTPGNCITILHAFQRFFQLFIILRQFLNPRIPSGYAIVRDITFVRKT